jgi:hypothetical protein
MQMLFKGRKPCKILCSIMAETRTASVGTTQIVWFCSVTFSHLCNTAHERGVIKMENNKNYFRIWKGRLELHSHIKNFLVEESPTALSRTDELFFIHCNIQQWSITCTYIIEIKVFYVLHNNLHRPAYRRATRESTLHRSGRVRY